MYEYDIVCMCHRVNPIPIIKRWKLMKNHGDGNIVLIEVRLNKCIMLRNFKNHTLPGTHFNRLYNKKQNSNK